MLPNREDFIGGWQLQTWEIHYADGKVTYPFGEDAKGLLLYTADGFMSGTIERRDRSEFIRTRPSEFTTEDKAGAFKSYFHYAGTWRLEGDKVIHTVTSSLDPAKTDSEQIRFADFKDKNTLVLSAEEPLSANEKRRHILTWRRQVARG